MAYRIGWYQKLGKQHIKRLDRNKYPSSEPSTPSYIYNKLNEKTDMTSKIK